MPEIVTAPWITHRVIDKGIQPREGSVVWDPLCGEGHIAEVLRKRGFNVLATDTDELPKWKGCDGVQDFAEVPECDPTVKLICTRMWLGDEHRAIISHSLDLMDATDGAVLLLAQNDLDSKEGLSDLFDRSPFAAKLVCVGENVAWYYWDWRYYDTPSLHYLIKKP